MVGAFLRTFFEGLDIKCSLAAYALLNDRDGEGYGMEKKRLSVRPIMLGLATAMGAYLVLLTLAAYLTVSGRLDEVRIGQVVWACACLSAFGGAMMTLRGKRGVAALPLLSELALPLVKAGGCFLAMKSVDSDAEIDSARGAIGQLGGKIEAIRDYAIPGTDVTHRVVIIRKVKDTPPQFPRSWARMKKAPLK